MNKYLREFIEETSELLDRADADLLALEEDPEQAELVSKLFRALHSIKGGCGLLGYTKTERLTHAGENLLARVRDRVRPLDREVSDALLRVVDATRGVLARLEEDQVEGDDDFGELIAKLVELRDGTGGEAVATTREKPARGPSRKGPKTAETPSPEHRAPTAAASRERRGNRFVPLRSESSVRVDVVLLDRLMNLVGELVLARNQIVQFSAHSEEAALTSATQRLNLITGELQEQVMKARMQPIDKVWSKLPRVVRDLAQACGKRVRIETEGADTELDRTIIEAIKDPLTHVVRNAVDHGIEPPEVRRDAGKAPEGVLRLRAFHEGGQVNIEIADDGRGLDLERIRKTALERGLTSPDRLAELSEREVLALIFEPGFSTADEVTTLSGRGVGMDVVKTNVELIGGSVEIDSQPGAGTTLRLKIPLTLAILPALLVTARGARYAIPQPNVRELVRIKAGSAARGIELVAGAPVYRLRGRLLPLVSLRELFEGQATDWSRVHDGHIVVLTVDGHAFGLVVDECLDTQEIVVKPLGHQLREATLFAGATIMEDGTVALILDALGIATSANLTGEGAALEEEAREPADDAQRGDHRLLLFVSDAGTPMALPLEEVSRLENFPLDTVERVGTHRVVQYGGEALPLVHADEALGAGTWEELVADAKKVSVAVHAFEGLSLGVVLGRILDVVDAPAGFDATRADAPEVIVVEGRSTQLVRVRELLDASRQGASERRATARAATGAEA